MSDLIGLIRRTKLRPDFFKLGIRALALFQLFLAYLLLKASGFGFEALEFSVRATGALLLLFLTYLLWIGSGSKDAQIRIRVALGCIGVGLLPLLVILPELVMGNWGTREWVLLGYFLTGSGAVLEMYWKETGKKN